MISSSPWEAVPVIIPILKSSADAVSASEVPSFFSPSAGAAVVASYAGAAVVAAGSALRHPAKDITIAAASVKLRKRFFIPSPPF